MPSSEQPRETPTQLGTQSPVVLMEQRTVFSTLCQFLARRLRVPSPGRAAPRSRVPLPPPGAAPRPAPHRRSAAPAWLAAFGARPGAWRAASRSPAPPFAWRFPRRGPAGHVAAFPLGTGCLRATFRRHRGSRARPAAPGAGEAAKWRHQRS